jgi:hypothetical protein
MPSDSRLLDIIRDLESKNWNLTFEVEIQKQNVRRLNSVLQKERDEGYEMADDLDQKEAELVKSEEGRAALEEKMRALQSLFEEEKLRAEAAENRAKEWEQKYNEVQQGNNIQSLARNVHIQAQFGVETMNERKRKHGKYFETQEASVSFKNHITSFLQTHIEVNETAFISTKRIQELYTEHMHQVPNNQLFCKNLRTQIPSLFPTAIPGISKQERGYHGIIFKHV